MISQYRCGRFGHRPHPESNRFRVPVFKAIRSLDVIPADGSEPQPIPYYTVKRCVECGYEERTYVNCTEADTK